MIKIGDILVGKINLNSSGSAYFSNEEIPKDIYIHSKWVNKSLHLDTVKILVCAGHGDRGIEGRVIEVVSRFKTEFVGVLKVSSNYAFFIPDNPKMFVDIFVHNTNLMGAMEGQKVVVKMTEWKANAKTPNGVVVKILGDIGENNAEIHSILHEHGLPYEFEEDVLMESEDIPIEIPQSEIKLRRDMRGVTTLTIDPIDAKDFDDALSIEYISDDLYRVGIHIADVSHYMRPDTALDKEAYRRGTSVYLVDRVVPMLPERLSNGLCSLRPNEDKLCFSVVVDLNSLGQVQDTWFGRTVINSNRRYTYEEAQEIIESAQEMIKSADSSFVEDKAILHLHYLARIMRTTRLKNGSLVSDRPEVKFVLDEAHKPTGIYFKTSKDANKLIEEFMLLANVSVAKHLNNLEVPMVNRAHDSPSAEKLVALRDFIKNLGYKIKIETPEQVMQSLNQLLLDIKGKPEEVMVSTIVLRSMQKANYITNNIGHYGLGFDDYTHFTSPIRRYPDVMVHRILGRLLDGKVPMKIDKVSARCKYLSDMERKAQKAERDSIKYMQTIFMSDKIGKVYKGLVVSVTEYGMFVELEDVRCEGMVRISEMQGDTFIADTLKYRVVGLHTQEIVKMGDIVTVVVKSIDTEKRVINLSLLRF